MLHKSVLGPVTLLQLQWVKPSWLIL